MKKYKTCVKNMEAIGMTRREIAEVVGMDEAVMSRRMNGRQEPVHEAVLVMNIVHDVFTADPEAVANMLQNLPMKENSTLKTLLKKASRRNASRIDKEAA